MSHVSDVKKPAATVHDFHGNDLSRRLSYNDVWLTLLWPRGLKSCPEVRR
jgi:hypothetical protein